MEVPLPSVREVLGLGYVGKLYSAMYLKISFLLGSYVAMRRSAGRY